MFRNCGSEVNVRLLCVPVDRYSDVADPTLWSPDELIPAHVLILSMWSAALAEFGCIPSLDSAADTKRYKRAEIGPVLHTQYSENMVCDAWLCFLSRLERVVLYFKMNLVIWTRRFETDYAIHI